MRSRSPSGSAARLFAGGAADALRAAGDCLEAAATERTGPYSGASPDELDRALHRMEAAGERPLALVATAGTTDFGSIDPLPALAERARERGLWLHVDAAWGGGLLFSDRHRGLLAGIEAADSVAVDFHKLLWQPAGCGAFLVRDRARLAPLEVTGIFRARAPPFRAGLARPARSALLADVRPEGLQRCATSRGDATCGG